MKSTVVPTLLALAAIISPLAAAPLATWDFTVPPPGQPGSQLETTGTGAPNITAGTVTRGSGLTPSSGATSISSSAWSTGALDANDYYQFSITVAAGYEADLNSILFGERRSSTGIRDFELRSSLDGYASAIGGTPVNVPDDTNTRNPSLTLGPGFDAITGTVTFRLYGYNAEADGGTWRIVNHSTAGGLVIEGGVPNITINEVDSDTAGTDAAEFIELYDGGVGPTPLDGFVVVLFNGDGDTSYAAYDLDGYSTNANGFFVLGNSGVTNVGLVFPGNFLQDGADAVAVYQGNAAGFPNGTAATTTNLVDAIVYGTDDADDTGLLTALGKSAQYNENENVNKEAESISRTPDGGAVISMVAPSPGTANPSGGGPLTLALGTNSISENGATPITATVSVANPVSGDLTVTVIISDESEAVSVDATILDGDTEGTFTIDAVDDLWPDGNQLVTVTVSAPTYDPDSETFTVTDDDTTFLLLVNEVYYGVSGSMLDANGDGTADQSNGSNDDEFVELVNTTAGTYDLAGIQLFDNVGTAFHTFPNGTTLGAGCAIVVFGGGNIPQGSRPGAFGTAEVQLANGSGTPGLYLGDTGDFVTIKNTFGKELHSVTLPDQSAQPAAGSYTLATDGIGSSGYVYHTTTAGAAAFSPGTRANGSNFCTLTVPVTVTLNVTSILETAGSVANAATISLPAVPAAPVTIHLSSSDTSELDVSSPVVISPPASSIDVALTAVDDTLVDGTQTVTLSARASGYLNGSGNIDVKDDGDTPAFTNLVINELDADTPGTDAAEFVELYNKTASPQSLDGLVLVFYNGNNDLSYAAYSLNGHSIPANGFFLLGNAAVPGVSIVFANNFLQNGQDAVALYVGSAADFPNNTPVTGRPNTLVDAVVYDTSDADDPGLLAALTPGQPQIDENGNGVGADQSIARVPNGGTALNTSTYVAQTPTPGATNVLPPTDDFAAWLDGNGYTATGFDTDSDLDGDNNGVEWYFFGTSPDVASNNGSPVSIAGAAAGGAFSFTHRRPVSRAGVTETYQYSFNLDGTWNPSDATVTITEDSSIVDPLDVDYQIVTIQVTVTPATTRKVFVRLELTMPT